MVVLVALLGVAAWLITRNMAKEGMQTAKNELGIEWYDENGTEFTITTMEELYDIAELSMYYDFAGQTIKLGADLVDNEGNAADWKDVEPDNLWESIYGFAGTFDGQGHTISGIYCRAELYFANINRVQGLDYVTAGLFRSTQEECVIKNLKVVNSYFESDLDYGAAVISSNGGGTFDTIYTDGIILSQKSYVGGIIGKITKPTKITNCWFDGSIEVVGGFGRFVGGIAGRVHDKSDTTIEHCLVSGDLSSDLYNRGVNMGGILGISVKSDVEIRDCLVTGTLHNDWNIVGSVMGNVATESTATMSDVYTCEETFDEIVGFLEGGTLKGMPVVYQRDRYVGYGGYEWTTLDFDNYWTIVEGGTPILQAFAAEKPSLEGVAKKIDTSWYNEQEDTFVLMDAEDFYGFAVLSNSTNFEGKTIKLGADIKLNDGKASTWKKEAPANRWICIGSKNYPFAGTFDGQMHSISGVYLNANAQYSGLFGVTTQTAVIKRFKLTNSYFESDKDGLGSIAGQAVGIFDTIYSDAIVTSSNRYVGGMIGRATEKKDNSIKMTNCWFDGTVTNTSNSVDTRMTGGLIGFVVTKTELSNCLNTGTVDVRSYKVPNDAKSEHVQPYAGGLFGFLYSGWDVKITDCMNTGNILMSDAVTSAAGSILGYSSGTTTVSNTYVTKESSKFTTRGNIVGDVIAFDKALITGYGGYQWTGLDFNKYWAVVLDDTSVLKSFAKSVPSLANVERKADISWYNAKADTYVLYDAADLRGFALLSKANDFKGKTVKLANDIVLNSGDASTWSKTAPETEWMSISTVDTRFAGTFDGQKHTISGLYMSTDEKYTGFFSGTADEAVVKNFRLTNSYLYSTQEEIGSIVGNGRGTFDGIYSDAIVESTNNVAGGLIGSTSWDGGVKVKNCWFDGEVTNVEKAASYYAGILARAYRSSTITNCINTGTITCDLAKQPRAGGIFGGIGRAETTVDLSYCLNAGDIVHGKGTKEQGLIVGYAANTINMDNSYSIAQGSNTLVATKADKTYPTCGVSGSAEEVQGTSALANASRLFVKKNSDGKYDNHWVAVVGSVPVPKKLLAYTSGEQFTPDVSWYDGSKEYTLKTKEQLYGFALLTFLTEVDGFSGKTIKLGADITLNEGNAADWKQTAPKYGWGSIGDSTAKFKGNFDGQKHTISGVYLNTTKQCQGFFGDITGDVKIANFSLVNSYFNYHGSHAYGFTGAVAGRATGNFENIYVNAIVESIGKRTAGLVGSTSTSGKLTINNCWNAGPVSSTNTYVGSLIGYADKEAPTIKNCMNTGAITTTYTEADATKNYLLAIGGLLGNSSYGTGVYNCLNLGSVNYTKTDYTTGAGMMVGSLDGSTTFKDLFTIKQEGTGDYYRNGVQNSGSVVKITSLDEIKGSNALTKMTKLFTIQTSDGNYDSYWSIVPNGTPVLTTFAKYVGGEHLVIDTSWYNSEKSSYELMNASDLYGLAVLSYKTNFDGKKITLGDDITINEDIDNPVYGWLSIGDSTAKFQGDFDGKKHTISGIYLDTTKQCQGLFGDILGDVQIANFSLVNSYFYYHGTNGNAFLGAVAGRASGTIKNIYSNATIEATGGRIGGIVGSTAGSATTLGTTIINCWNAGAVSNSTPNLAGIIGWVENNNTTISNCLNTGDITTTTTNATPSIGGLIGFSSKNVTINNSLNAKALSFNTATATAGYGMIAGNIPGTSTFKDLVTVPQDGVGEYNATGQTSNVSTLTLDEIKGINALIRVKKMFTTQTSDEDYEGYWSIVPNGHPVLTSFEKYAQETPIAIDISWYGEDYELKDVSDLYGFAALSYRTTFEGKKITLGDDIEVNKEFGWLPIGTVSDKCVFNGEFDGKMHTISGITLNTSSSYQGLFSGTGAKAEIRNLYLKDSSFVSSAGDQLGSIAGNAMGIFENIYSEAVVVSNGCNQVGGLLGATSTSKGVTMTNCWFAGSVTCNAQKSYFGGLIGRVANTSTITNCLNTGDVTHNGSVNTNGVGGFVGYVDKSSVSTTTLNINHSVNAATVTVAGGQYYGLFVGKGDGTVNATNSHSLNKSGYTFVYNKSNDAYSTCGRYTAAEVAGDKVLSQAKIGKLFTEDAAKGYWSTNANGFPVLTTFVKTATNQ